MKKLMAVAFAVLACAALAQGKEGSKEGPRRGAGDAVMAAMNPKVAEQLGVPEDVRARLKQIDAEARAEIKDLQSKTRAAMEKQAKLMKAPKIDEDAVMAVIDELFDLRKAMAKAQTKRVIAVKSQLSPEQLAKALEIVKAFREKKRDKGEKEAKAEKPAKPEKEARAAKPEKSAKCKKCKKAAKCDKEKCEKAAECNEGDKCPKAKAD